MQEPRGHALPRPPPHPPPRRPALAAGMWLPQEAMKPGGSLGESACAPCLLGGCSPCFPQPPLRATERRPPCPPLHALEHPCRGKHRCLCMLPSPRILPLSPFPPPPRSLPSLPLRWHVDTCDVLDGRLCVWHGAWGVRGACCCAACMLLRSSMRWVWQVAPTLSTPLPLHVW